MTQQTERSTTHELIAAAEARLKKRKELVLEGKEFNIIYSDLFKDPDDAEALGATPALEDEGLLFDSAVLNMGKAKERVALGREFVKDLNRPMALMLGTETEMPATPAERELFGKVDISVAENSEHSMSGLMEELHYYPDESINLVCISSPIDMLPILRDQKLAKKIKSIVFMGSAEINEGHINPKVAEGGAANFQYSPEESKEIFRLAVERKIPMVVVSKLATGQAKLPKQFFDRLVLETNENPTAVLIEQIARTGIIDLWHRVLMPVTIPLHTGSADNEVQPNPLRTGIKAVHDVQWFATTFCGGISASELPTDVNEHNDDIVWEKIVEFMPYDLLTIAMIKPDTRARFLVEKKHVENGVTHIICDEVQNGKQGELKEYLMDLLIRSLQKVNREKAEGNIMPKQY